MRRHWAMSCLWTVVLAASACSGSSDDRDQKSDPSSTETDAGAVSTATVPITPGEPVSAPDKEWQYVEVPGTLCRDGATTGFAININPASDKLVIYMEGGGACFNPTTCAGNPRSYAFSANITTPVLTRDDINPFADWNMVYVPYCSGDVFTGTNMQGSNGEPQIGYVNVGKFLERIVPTFKDKVTTVVLTGASAGGFGTAWNWLRVQDAFGEIPVHALDDSGPPMGEGFLTPCMQQFVAQRWGWKDSVHPACTECNVDQGTVVRPLMDMAIKRQAGRRFGLFSNDEDGVIKLFFAYGLDDCKRIDEPLTAVFSNGGPPAYPMGKFPEGLADLRSHLAGESNAALFEIKGGSHVVVSSANAWSTMAGTTSALQWVTWFRDGDAQWGNVMQ